AWGWFNWLCRGLKAVGDWTGWWNLGCDNRPTSITYTLDSIAMRVGWSPSVAHDDARNDFDSPRNASDACAQGNCQSFVSADLAATKDGQSAYTVSGTGTGNSFWNLRFILQDPNLL